MAKKRVVQVSFREDQLLAIKRAAEREGLQVAPWLRHIALRMAEWVPPSPKDADSFKAY